MRKLVAVLAVAAVAVTVVVAPAIGQDRPVTKFVSKVKIFPKKAGTKKNPRGIKIVGSLKMRTITEGVEPPIVTGGDVMIPKGGKYNGGKYPKCGRRVMERAGSTDRCPRKSIMGKGSGVALADTVDAAPDVVFVNGGKRRLWAFTTLYNPALVQEPIAVNIKPVRSRKWAYRVTFRVPKVLQVVAGVPITLRSFRFSIGRKPYARNYLVTTSCPRSKKYPYEATAYYLYNDGTTAKSRYKGSVACL